MIETPAATVPEDVGIEQIMVSGLTGKRHQRKYADSKRTACSECGTTETIQISQTGDTVCANCGLVVSERRIDPGAEWRAFTTDERNARARTGSPIKYTSADKGLLTTLGWGDRDSSGRKFTSERRAAITRMRKWQIRSRVHTSIDSNLTQALSEIERLSSQMRLERGVKELAAMLYRKTIVKKLVRSRSIDGLAAAAIYAALRLRKLPQSLKDIAKHTHLNFKTIGKYYRLLVKRLRLKMPVPDPKNYVPKLISRLELPGEMQEKVFEVLEDARNHNGLISGRDPRGLAAGAIYIASIVTENRVTQREIAAAAGVTEVTVRNRYKELVRELDIRLI